MLNLIKQKWIEWLVSITLVVITVLLTDSIKGRRDTKTSIQAQIEKKANIEYVDAQNNNTRLYIDKQDQNILNMLNQHAEETAKTSQVTLDWLKAINTKLDRIDYRLTTVK